LLLAKKSEKQGAGKIQDNHVEKYMPESIMKKRIRQQSPRLCDKNRRF
jgi:hypothetical protein